MLLRSAFTLLSPGVDPSESQIKVTEQAEGYLARVTEGLRAEGGAVKTVVQYGFPAGEISDHLERGNSDLLALATHGRTGPACLVMGSVAEKVLRSTSVLVLLFRASGKVAGAGWQPTSTTYGKKGR